MTILKPLNEWQMIGANAAYQTMPVWISAGLVDRYSAVNKFGRNPDVDTSTTPEDLWGGNGLYTGFPVSTSEPVEVLSSSASDTAAGTGLHTVTIQGLNQEWAQTSETLTLNGTTPVQSVNTYRRVHTMRGVTAGSGGSNAGTVTVRHATTEANIFLVMQIGYNQTNCAAYTIPAGYKGYLMSSFGTLRGTNQGTADCVFAIRNFGEVYRYRRPFTISPNFEHNEKLVTPIELDQKTDIVLRCLETSASNLEISGSYELVLVSQ